MRYRNTLIMVGVLVVLVVVAVLLLGNPAPTNAPGTGHVWSYANETVTDINMSQDNGKHTEVLLKDGNWSVITGTQILPANQAQVTSAANLLLQLQGDPVARGNTALKDYGLDPPRTTITVTFQSGKTATLLVGATLQTNSSQYYVADKAQPDKVFTNGDQTVTTLLAWFTAPPLPQPTPTPLPLAPTNTPAPSVITGTATLTGTGTLTTTSPITGSHPISGTLTTTSTTTVTSTTTITSSGTVTK